MVEDNLIIDYLPIWEKKISDYLPFYFEPSNIRLTSNLSIVPEWEFWAILKRGWGRGGPKSLNRKLPSVELLMLALNFFLMFEHILHYNIGLYKPNQIFQICLWCKQILFNEIEPMEYQDLSTEIQMTNSKSKSKSSVTTGFSLK